MDIPVKTLKSGFALPAYGLGTWRMGGDVDRDTSNDDVYIAAIRAALDQGVTHIDTAELYGAGHTEELVGRAIKGYDRSKLIITTKVLSGMADGYDGVLRAAEASLKRLDTDYIDLYLLHRYSSMTLTEVTRALDRLVEQGLVKHIGVCNMGVEAFEDTQKHTANKLVCNQVDYNLQIREAERKGVLAYCQQNDIFLTAWGPLNKGLIDHGYLLREIAQRYNRTPYQVALNWLISQPNVVVIPKTTKLEHLEENLGVLGWQLEPEDMRRLTKDFPGQLSLSERVSLA